MKKLKHILLFVIMHVAWVQLLHANNLQQSAEKAYAAKDYKLAIENYEAIMKEGLVSYKLYYNLGNAYYKNHELGKAIYNYELAHKLAPTNQDVKNNLQIAADKTIDKIESKENFFVGAIKSGVVSALSEKGWAWLSIISLTIALILFFIFYITQQVLLKRIGFSAGIIFLICFAVSMMLGYTAINDKSNIRFAIVLAKESKIYEEPIKETKSKFNLHEGTKVKVLESNAEWTNIKLENGNEGWLPTAELGLF